MPTPTAYTDALDQLGRIERARWPQHGQVARHYEAVIDVLRDYLEDAEGRPPRSGPRRELIWALPPQLSDDGLRDEFHELLGQADLVKFARLRPGSGNRGNFLDQCRALLQRLARDQARPPRWPMRFADPALLLLPTPSRSIRGARWRNRRRCRPIALRCPRIAFLEDQPRAGAPGGDRCSSCSALLAIALLVAALARPQTPRDVREIRLRSRNIMLALDISSSMKAGDFQPGNRLAVARRVVTEFVQRREGDLVGPGDSSPAGPFSRRRSRPTSTCWQTILARVDIGHAARWHRHRHGARAESGSAQGSAGQGQHHRPHHRRRQQHRQAHALLRRRQPGRSASGFRPSGSVPRDTTQAWPSTCLAGGQHGPPAHRGGRSSAHSASPNGPAAATIGPPTPRPCDGS